MIDPRSVVPESIMPSYSWLAEWTVRDDDIAEHLKTLRAVGVPYTDEMVEAATADLAAQADPNGDHEALLARYPKALVGDFDGKPETLSELDALIAYLQVLGTLVEFEESQEAGAAAPADSGASQ
jgi:cytochrome c oxidase cbb3-type subunit 2